MREVVAIQKGREFRRGRRVKEHPAGVIARHMAPQPDVFEYLLSDLLG
jgi:hypothetical protein